MQNRVLGVFSIVVGTMGFTISILHVLGYIAIPEYKNYIAPAVTLVASFILIIFGVHEYGRKLPTTTE